MKKIQLLTPESFKPYGQVLNLDPSDPSGFQIKVSETQGTGWRMAAKKTVRHNFSSLQRHPDSMESFTPLSGTTILIVAPSEFPEEFEPFLLDKSVCLHKNIWHATICLSEYSLTEVTENFQVDSESFELGKTYNITLG